MRAGGSYTDCRTLGCPSAAVEVRLSWKLMCDCALCQEPEVCHLPQACRTVPVNGGAAGAAREAAREPEAVSHVGRAQNTSSSNPAS